MKKANIRYEVLLNDKIRTNLAYPAFILLDENLKTHLIVEGYNKGNMKVIEDYLIKNSEIN